MIEPRHCWYPPADRSLGDDAIAFWKAAGGVLFDWQEFAIRGILGLVATDEGERWASRDDGLDVARQNGKGVVLQVIETFLAFELGYRNGYKVLMHTAHEFATSQEHQLRLEDFIRDAPHLHARVKDKGGYVHANGQESIRLKDGTRIIFKARTGGGGRGYTADFLAWDEAMEIPDKVVGAQKPMLRASSGIYGPKTIYAGSAVDQEVHQHGVTFARIREQGIAHAPNLSWVEWSAPFEDPAEMTSDLLDNREWWPAGNPSMEHGLIHEDTMADELRTMPPRTGAVELLGVGSWPRTDGRIDTVVSIEKFDSLARATSKLQPPYSIFFDTSPERKTSVAFAGRNEVGKFHAEIHEHRQGTAWLLEWLPALNERAGQDIYAIACDGVGPAASLVLQLEELGVRVERVNSSEMGEMCGRFVDMVSEDELEHLGSPELREALLGASTRPLGERWAWSRKSSRVDISPLVAATGALGLAAGISSGDLAIF